MRRDVKIIKEWWEETALAYQKTSAIGTSAAHYGPYAPDEDELKLLGKIRGKKILEIGCGGGQCSIAFAKKGAICTGIDISKTQLNYARKLAETNKVKVNFIEGDFHNLHMFKDGSFDIVFSAFALQYSPNLSKVFCEVNRVLKKNGLLVFSLDHPFYLLIDPQSQKLVKSYFKTGREQKVPTWQNKTKKKFLFYRYKVSDIYNTLVATGFFVERIIEPLALKKSKIWAKGPWRKIYPLKTVKLIGPTIIFKSRKLSFAKAK